MRDGRRWGTGWRLALSWAIVVTTVIGSVWGSDEWLPFAPFRMFANATSPDGEVGVWRVRITSGTHTHTYNPGALGLRHAELEENTPADRRVPDATLADLAATFERRHPGRRVDHLQVLVLFTRLRNGSPVGPRTERILGDWAAPDYSGPRVTVPYPEDPPWKGHSL